jgi:hypothetical protein
VGSRIGLDDVDEKKFLTLPGLELRTLGRPARSQSLYRLRYPGFGCGLDSTGLGERLVAGSCKNANESSDSIQGEELFDKFGNYELLKEDSAPCS